MCVFVYLWLQLPTEARRKHRPPHPTHPPHRNTMLKLQAIVSHLMGMLGTELQSSAKIVF